MELIEGACVHVPKRLLLLLQNAVAVTNKYKRKGTAKCGWSTINTKRKNVKKERKGGRTFSSSSSSQS